MDITSFPKYDDAPWPLLSLDGSCGPVTIWATLKYFNKRASAKKIIERCRHTNKHGTFAIAMAIALREFGLDVDFYSDDDPKPHLIERQCYKLARQLGVPVNPPVEVKLLCSMISQNCLPIVLYDTPDGVGHFSPLLGIIGRKLILPFDKKEFVNISDFCLRWGAKGIYRQCLVVS